MAEFVLDGQWVNYKNFSRSEFECSYTGACKMNPVLLYLLQKIRNDFGRSMIINSGYRDPSHPIEARKKNPGEHSLGMAADIRCSGTDAIELVGIAINLGVKRIGIAQKGVHTSRFIHLGIADKLANYPASIWSY